MASKSLGIGRRRWANPFAVLGISLAVLLLLLIVYPLGAAFIKAFTEGGQLDWTPLTTVLSDPEFHEAAKNTGIVLVTAGPAAILIASVFAWLNERTDAGFGLASVVLPLVPLFIPAIALSIGWVLLAHPRAGFLNGMMRSGFELVGVQMETGPLDIGTWPGMLFAYIISLVPYAYLVVAAGLRNMDPALEEASRMSGSGPWRTVVRVSLPAIRPALMSAVLLVVIIGISAFSVPRTIGLLARIDTVSVYIIRLTQSFPSRLDDSVAVSLLILVVVGSVWTLQRRATRGGHHATIAGKSSAVTTVKLGRWRWVVRGVMALYLLCVSVLPFAALVTVALQPFWQPTIDFASMSLDHFRDFFDSSNLVFGALVNSLRLGVIGATLGMTVATIVTIYARMNRGYQSGLIGGVTKVPGAISNLVIGVALLVTLAAPPFDLGGTLIILVIGYLVVYMPQASIAAEVARTQVGDELVEASSMHGGSQLRTVRRVLLPLMKSGLAAGWALVFVVVVGDLTISAVLSGVGNLVVGSMFLSIWEQGVFAQLATLGTIVCLTTASAVGIVLALSRRRASSSRTRSVDVALPDA